MATITIAAIIPKKSGATNGRRWTLYEIRTTDGKTYTTFDAGWNGHVGETFTVEVASGNRLGPIPEAGVPNSPNAQVPSEPDKFAVLSGKLDRLLTEMAAIRRHFT